jgi:S-adenosylmethionine:tRNA ribosyltransferase-isomerase
MIAATVPVQRPPDARLLVVNADGRIDHRPRSDFATLLRSGDLVIANDAATLPASLFGVHLPTGQAIEVRLAGRESLCSECVLEFMAVVFGEGDYRTPTESRPLPPILRRGDRLQLGILRARVLELLDHPRLISIGFENAPREIWEGIARHGRPIQYSHLTAPLDIWDTWTPIAGPAAAFEPPSAGFMLDWSVIAAMRHRGVQFATLTHAAGISSTGDRELDSRLPFDEPYLIPAATAELVNAACARGDRVIAIGTTVVRALEHAVTEDGIVPQGEGLARQRLGPGSALRVVDAILSGVHERGTSHHRLLEAFINSELLARVDEVLEGQGYRTHEFGDSMFVERMQELKVSKTKFRPIVDKELRPPRELRTA